MRFQSTCGSLSLIILLLSCTARGEYDTEKGWINLFNGKDFSGWAIKIKGYPLHENADSTFRVKNGAMQVSYDSYSKWDQKYGHIFFNKKFSAYLLSLEYRFTGDQVEGGADWAYRNSGVMLHAQSPETMAINQDFPVSVEAQFLGGNGKDPRTTGNLCTPGTHVTLGDTLYTPHCVSSSSKTYHGDQWVQFQALVLGDSIIRHIVEGDTVLVYRKPQVDGSDDFVPSSVSDGQSLREGFISLQSESHPVEFRNIKLFNLEQYLNTPDKLRGVLSRLQNRQNNL